MFGLIVFSITVSNILIIFFFAIPFTKKLNKHHHLKNNHIVNDYLVTVFIYVIILFSTTLLFYVYFFNTAFISLIIGYGFGVIGIIVTLNKHGLSFENFSEYYSKNKEYFWEVLINKHGDNTAQAYEYYVAIINHMES
jgi:hypothetical protein